MGLHASGISLSHARMHTHTHTGLVAREPSHLLCTTDLGSKERERERGGGRERGWEGGGREREQTASPHYDPSSFSSFSSSYSSPEAPPSAYGAPP